MSDNVTRDHYARLAASYDENWAYSPEFVEWMTKCIQQRLQLTASELALDVGCGTGLFARGLARHAAAVACVEPSDAMRSRLPRGNRIIPVAATAEELASGGAALPHERYDAMLLKEMVHHVDSRRAVIAGLSRLLRPGGRLLVVMLPKQVSYPLFADALRLFTSLQPDPADIASLMREAGLDAELSYESFALSFATERYLQMVRDRYMSLLSHFDDAQLEAGVAEIRRSAPGDQIAFNDVFAFVLGTKA